MMWTLWMLSLVTVTSTRFFVSGVDRNSNPRQLVNTLEINPEWQKYFAEPIGPPVEQKAPEEDMVEEGPGHAWVVAPHLQSVIQSRGGKGGASGSSRSSAKSGKKGKHKSKSKRTAGSEYDDDFFYYFDNIEASEDANDIDAESSYSHKSKGLKKKISNASGDRKPDCQFMNGVYFGKDCEESQERRSKRHKHEKYSPSPAPASDSPPAHITYPPDYPPSYMAPPPIYVSPAAVPPPYGTPTAPSTPIGFPKPVYAGPVMPASSAAIPTSEGVNKTLAPVQVTNKIEGSSPAALKTASPTSAPALGIVAAPTSAYKVKTVTTILVLVRVTGTFDPETQDEMFFDVLRDNFAPYSRASIGRMLTSFDLNAEFIDQNENEVKSAVRTSWIEVKVTYHIGTDDMILLDAFTPESGSVLLTKFFQSQNGQRLIQALKAQNIPVATIEVHSTSPDDSTARTKEGEGEGVDPSVPPASISSAQNEESSDSRKEKIIASVSGSIIILAIAAVLVKNRQSHKHAIFDDKGSVTSDYSRTDVYSGTPGGIYVPSESTSYVKPAALHVRNKREREIDGKAPMSSNSTISSYQSNGTTKAERADKNKKKSLLRPGIEDKNEEAADEDSSGQADSALVPYADGSDCIATGRALKCLDGEESVGAMNEAYPEFDLYHSAGLAPPSPGWSISNFSSMSRQYGIVGDDGDYSTSRKRWHDEANDLDLIALPDHSSDLGYASNDDDRSQSSTKSKGKSSI